MALTIESPLEEFLASHRGRAILAKHAPAVLRYPNLPMVRRFPLERLRTRQGTGLSADTLEAIARDLARPAEVAVPEATGHSLDALDRESFRAGPGPFDSEPEPQSVQTGAFSHPAGPIILSLDGPWDLGPGGLPSERLGQAWPDAIPARDPGSVHTALVEAGKIPDPTVGQNQKIARQESFKTWWLKRTFRRPTGSGGERLVFGGVCNRCTVWLNGAELGGHEGMFGGPEFDVAELLREENTLVVRLDPIPFEKRPEETANPDNNFSWRHTVVFNNVYGWHYSNLPSLGIWRSVELRAAPTVALVHPFVATRDVKEGIVDLALRLDGPERGWSGRLRGTIRPENFDGGAFSFEREVRSNGPSRDLHLRLTVPDPRPWWPVDLGDPNLYHLELSFTPIEGQPDRQALAFGLRTVEMAPLPDGPQPDKYNWTFVINGTPHFVKGTGWCTMDPLMDFSGERYDRFLTLATDQHVQMLRGWGSGMPETDEFYDGCDRKGIMVLQEWPTAWDSHLDQPYDLLEETVRRNTLRLRNHPSLVMWGAGNESPNPFGPAIDMMGRLSRELDGTRPFHRGEPWGGSIHNYDCYWGRRHLDDNLNLTADFFGEFGLACLPVYESVQRYLPDDEKDLWPPPPDGSFAYHTPIFNTREDLSRLTQYARYFVPADASMEAFTIGSQLSQAIGVRHALELARTRWPDCAGALYYKMNDNFPAASWSCVDWYGAPKIGHYVFQDAFAPLHACVIFSTLNVAGTPAEWPVFLLDDADRLRDASWRVVVRAYDQRLREVKRAEFRRAGSIAGPSRLGSFALSAEETDTAPLLIIAEVIREGTVADRTFYWLNFEAAKGCLFTLPRTRLSLAPNGNRVTVRNVGDVPAVAVNVARPGHLDRFRVSDNYFWLDPAEEQTLAVSSAAGLTVGAWNAGA